MDATLTNVIVAATATVTAALDSQRRNNAALRTVAASEIGRPALSCFHSHFRSKLLNGVPFDNTMSIDEKDESRVVKTADWALNRLHPHMWSKRNFNDPPVECASMEDDCSFFNSSYNCTMIDDVVLTRLYGSGYANSTLKEKVASFVFNGVPMVRGKAYCLPNDLIAETNSSVNGCDHIAGELEITYDAKQHRFASTCFCKWPDFFTGPMCNEYVGCKIDSGTYGDPVAFTSLNSKTTYAPLVNRDTLDEISDIRDLHRVWHARDGNIDLYATSIQLGEYDGPAWYCACKKLDSNLTGGMIAGSCIADPCLPSTNYMRLNPLESRMTINCLGTRDDRNPKLERWNCDCGSANRIFGGGDTPCAPFSYPAAYADFRVIEISQPGGGRGRTVDNVKCLNPRQIFIPCKNKYRPYFSRPNESAQTFLKCSDIGFPGIANPDELAEGGMCVDVCSYCNATFHIFGGNNEESSDLCSTTNHVIGFCKADQASGNANLRDTEHTFKCSCSMAPLSRTWKVTTPPHGPCIGEHVFKENGEYCDRKLHISRQGPECYYQCINFPFAGYRCTESSTRAPVFDP